MTACSHEWHPCAAIGCPGRMCEKCNCWETITKSHFKQMFKTSFWRWHKAYCDQFVYGGWKGRKNSERAKISLGRKLMKGFGI